MHVIESIILNIILIICITQLACCQNELFKINKLNLVWSKAQHSLGESKLKDLKSDLAKHEFDELTLKKMKAHNQDKEGLYEATVRKRLHLIMSKYSIERYLDDIHPLDEDSNLKKINLSSAKDNQKGDLSELKSTFRDKKLDKLWKKAEKSGFTQEQLMILHEEFQDQQDKLDQHYDAMNNIEQKVEARNKEAERLENSIDSTSSDERNDYTKETSSEKKLRPDVNVHQILEENYKGIKKNIQQLEKKVLSGEFSEEDGPFEETSVNNLWRSAIDANFSRGELESFKEELEHYEVRIKKLKHFQVQLERKSIQSKDSMTSDETDGDESKHIRRRVKDLTQKVDKTHKSLEKKIINRRVEL